MHANPIAHGDNVMTIVEELFRGVNVVSTHQIAAAFDISEADARDWADELEVAKIGASYAWTRSDAEALEEARDADEEEEADEGDGDDEEPDEDEEEEDDDDEDEG